MVGDPGDAAVHIGAAQILGADDLAGRGLHQRRAGEKDRALALDDDAFIRHRRDIGAARCARAHDDSNLRHALRRQICLVVEDPAEMLAVGEHLVLRRQERAARIDEVEAGQPVVSGDLLGAQMLLDGHREIGAALDRRVVGDDDAFAAADPPDPGDDPGRRHRAIIHAIGGEGREFEKGRPRIEQQPHPLARQQFAAPLMPFARRFVAALPDCAAVVAARGGPAGRAWATPPMQAPARASAGSPIRALFIGLYAPLAPGFPWHALQRSRTKQGSRSRLRHNRHGPARLTARIMKSAGLTRTCSRKSTRYAEAHGFTRSGFLT